jgi:hypothetical protein
VHTLQPRVMPEIIARCGMRWWNAKANEQVASVVRSVVITHNLGGYGGSYDALRANEPKSEGKMVKHLRVSQQHTATCHMNSSSTLIAKLFRAPPASETCVNHVKLTVFGV